MPFGVILLANFLVNFDLYRKKLLPLAQEFIHSSTHAYLNYVFGFWLLTLILDVIKCLVGRLRPNFIEMCQPDNLDICKVDPNAFIETTTCLASWKKARNAHMSFPSGHAAGSVFAFLFILYYLQQLYSRKNTTMTTNRFRYFISGFYALFMVYCCVSRVTDFWHFSTDVLGGCVLAGVLFAILYLKRRR